MNEKCCVGFHKEAKNGVQLKTLRPCSLFAKEAYAKGGMKTSGQICVFCCLQVHKVLDARRELIMKRTISSEDERQNKDMVVQFLDNGLTPFAEAMLKAAGSFAESERECQQCAARDWSSVPRYAPSIKLDQATEMNYTRKL